MSKGCLTVARKTAASLLYSRFLNTPRPFSETKVKPKEEKMRKFLLLSLIISAESLAAGICIVCPPGYDCSTGKPVAHTGNARLATIGDIPTTAAQIGAVPTTRRIGGIELSSDITLLQVEQLVRDAQEAKREADDCEANRDAVTVQSKCSASNIGSAPTGSGKYCWCRMQGTSHRCNIHSEQDFSSWVFHYDFDNYGGGGNTDANICAMDCYDVCRSTSWRAVSVW